MLPQPAGLHSFSRFWGGGSGASPPPSPTRAQPKAVDRERLIAIFRDYARLDLAFFSTSSAPNACSESAMAHRTNPLAPARRLLLLHVPSPGHYGVWGPSDSNHLDIPSAATVTLPGVFPWPTGSDRALRPNAREDTASPHYNRIRRFVRFDRKGGASCQLSSASLVPKAPHPLHGRLLTLGMASSSDTPVYRTPPPPPPETTPCPPRFFPPDRCAVRRAIHRDLLATLTFPSSDTSPHRHRSSTTALSPDYPWWRRCSPCLLFP